MNRDSERGPDVPILVHKYYDFPSVFTPENLLREARRLPLSFRWPETEEQPAIYQRQGRSTA